MLTMSVTAPTRNSVAETAMLSAVAAASPGTRTRARTYSSLKPPVTATSR